MPRITQRARFRARSACRAYLPGYQKLTVALAGLSCFAVPVFAASWNTVPLPLSGTALIVAQRAYLECAQHQSALCASDAREAIRQRPDVASLRVLLANALVAAGDRPAAQQALTEAIAQIGPDPSLTDRRRQLDAPPTEGIDTDPGAGSDLDGAAFEPAKMAYQAYARHDYEMAISKVEQAITLRPHILRLRLLLIDALAAQGNDASAFQADLDAAGYFGDRPELRERRLDLGTKLAPPLSIQAWTAQVAGDTAAALRLSTQAVGYAAPDRVDYRLQLIQLLLQQGDLAQVEAQAGRLLAVQPNAVTVWALRAAVREAQGDMAGGASDVAQVLKIDAAPLSERRMASLIVADLWLAQQPGSDGTSAAGTLLDAMPALGDPSDAMVSTRRYRIRQQTTAGGITLKASAPIGAIAAALPQIICHDYPGGVLCQIYPADAGLTAQQAFYAAVQNHDTAAALAAARAAARAAPLVPQHQFDLIDALVSAGDPQGASAVAKTTVADGMLAVMPARDAAYIALRAGDLKLALTYFQQAQADGVLPPAATADLAYAAQHAQQNELAAAYFKQAIDLGLAPPDGTPAASPVQLQDERQAHAEVTRNWGASTSLNYRGQASQSGLGVAPTQGVASSNNFQSSAEVYWRPFGSLDERMLEVYVRDNESFGVQDGPSGNSTNQVALGVRGKPLADVNAIFALERIVPLGSATHANWLGRAAYSTGIGTERRLDVPSWWTVAMYAEAGHYFIDPSNYATAYLKTGRSYRMDSISPDLVIFPFLVAGADYDSSIDRSVPSGVGAGVSSRYYFRENRYNAPRSFVDASVQYRVRVAGDARGGGWFFGLLLSY